MAGFGESRREARLNADYEGIEILSDTMYNLLLGGVVLYGLGLSLVLSLMLRPYAENLQYYAGFILIGYFVLAFAGIMLSGYSSNPIVSFVGYNMLVVPIGVVLSLVLAEYTAFEMDIVAQALLYTVIITACMTGLSVLNPSFFLGLGGILFSVLSGLLISGVVCFFMGWSTAWQAWIAVILFSFYIGYDFQRSQQFEKTVDNAVDCALDIYLDVINLFLRILQILGNSKRRR